MGRKEEDLPFRAKRVCRRAEDGRGIRVGPELIGDTCFQFSAPQNSPVELDHIMKPALLPFQGIFDVMPQQ